jgi:hypothetical protein
MSVLGRKVKNTGQMIGSKIRRGGVIGKKLLSDAASQAIVTASGVERSAGRLGKSVDVIGRKVANTAGMVDRNLARVQPLLDAVPITRELGMAGRDLAKVARAGAGEARVVGRDLTKLSERGLAQKVEKKLNKFV